MIAMSKIILDLCGGSGAWSFPYTAAGYDVRLVTLPDNNVLTYTPPANVYGILAAPPCQMFSLARQRAKIPRDLVAGMETVKACINIIWACRISGSLKFWALENPAHGYMRQFLGKPAFTFQPAEFGANYTKRTCLWGYFKEPVREFKYSKGSLPQLVDIVESAAERSITPEGFARAFFKANR